MATAAPAPDGRLETAPPWRWRGVVIAIAGVALLGGVVLRVATASPLWLDEALSVEIASLGFDDMVEALRHDGHPALYYVLLGWWIDLFGDSDVAVRALSGVASLAAVPVLWAIGARRSPTVGRIAAVVALSSPYLLRYGTETRMYALTVLELALTWLAVERALDRPTPGRLGLVAVGVAALVHTHYWTFFAIGGAGVVLLVTAVRDRTRRPAALRVIGAIAAGGATFVIWLPVFLDQIGTTGTPWADRARPTEIAIETIQGLGGNGRFEGEILGYGIVVLALFGALGIPRPRGVEVRAGVGPLSDAATVAVLTLGLGAGAALLTAGAFEARYAAVVVPVVVVLVARGVAVLPERFGVVVLAGLVVAGLAVGVDEARRDRTQAGDVAAVIDAEWQPGDVVAFCPDQLGPATRRELTVPAETIAYPRGDGRLVDWRDYAAVIDATPATEFVDEVLEAAGDGDVWLVAGLGYRSLDNRCEEIIDVLGGIRGGQPRVVPGDTFERMLLLHYPGVS